MPLCLNSLVETKQSDKKTIQKDMYLNIRIKNEYEALR